MMSNSESRKRLTVPTEPSTLRERVEATLDRYVQMDTDPENIEPEDSFRLIRDLRADLDESRGCLVCVEWEAQYVLAMQEIDDLRAVLATPDSPRSGALSDSLSLESGRSAESGEVEALAAAILVRQVDDPDLVSWARAVDAPRWRETLAVARAVLAAGYRKLEA